MWKKKSPKTNTKIEKIKRFFSLLNEKFKKKNALNKLVNFAELFVLGKQPVNCD